MSNLPFFEYTEKPLPFSTEEAKKFEQFLVNNSLSEVFSITPSKIKAKNYVGVIKYKKHQFEILPKLLGKGEQDRDTILKNLFYMLSYTKKLDIKEKDVAKLSKCENPFLEVLIGIYANSLLDSLLRFIPKNYVLQEENLGWLKGKIKFNENIKENLTNKARFYCEYDEFFEDNLLNQLFNYVCLMLSKVTSNEQNRKTLKKIINIYSEVSFVPVNKEKIQNLKLSRSQMSFEKPFRLAKMFIENSSVEMSAKKFNTIALIWDMNLLFEEFIYEFIRKKFPEIRVEFQKKKNLIQESFLMDDEQNWQKRGTKRKITRSDIVLTLPNGQKVIIDTKYKELNDNQSNFDPADFYQVLAYKQLHRNKSEEVFPEVVLLYPQSLKNNSAFKWKHSVNNQNGDCVYIFSVSLCKDLKENIYLYQELDNLIEILKEEERVLCQQSL